MFLRKDGCLHGRCPMVWNLVVVRFVSSRRLVMMVWAVENFWVKVWIVYAFLGWIEDYRAANSRAGMCILSWTVSSKGKGFGGSSVCSEALELSLY